MIKRGLAKQSRHIMVTLPSLWQIGDEVLLQFPGSGELNNAKVIKISFVKNDILYDVEVPYRCYTEENPLGTTKFARLHGLNEWHLRQKKNDLDLLQTG